ncbi:MAG: lactonase family protein [Caldilineaceae bacterium]|nr:lactonase family protein [Caldilineaceae bacterium]
MAAQNDLLMMYVGTYTRRESHVAGKSSGIQVCHFNTASGEITYIDTATGIVNPSFLAIHPTGRFLYSVSEMGERIEGKPAGGIAAFQIDPETGTLTALNQQPSLGSGPCHLVVDATGRFVLATNYASGGVCVLPIRADGTLGTSTDFIQHEGSSVNPQRQQEPHPHSINLDASNAYALVPDLGTDKVMIYAFDAEQGKLKLNSAQPWARSKSGAGPRHLDFHPNQRFVYVGNELDSTVIAFEFDATRGTLKEISTLSTLPENYEETSQEKSWVADVHVHPSGDTLYVSNRGHDSIAIFDIDQESGELTAAGYTSTKGKYPRNFAVDSEGKFLLAANQNSDDIYVFRIDAKTGTLEDTGFGAEIPTPVCIKLLAL